MIFSSSSSNDQSLLCIDLGTASIKACVAVLQEGQWSLKGYSATEHPYGAIHAGKIVNLAETLQRIQEAVKKAENMAKCSPRDMVLAFSGEMVRGMVITLPFLRDKPEKRIDAQELKTILYQLQWQAFDEIRRHIADDLSIAEVELKLLNTSVTTLRIDGEEVPDLKGMNGRRVEVEIFHCFAPLPLFGQIHTMAVELPYHTLKGVFIDSFALGHCLTLCNALASAIIIDMGAGVTDICVVVDGKIIGNRSFSLGGNTLTKRISHELSTSFAEAEAIKIKYAEGELEKRSHKIIGEALKPDIHIWMSSVEFSLKELPLKTLPQTILLCGQASQLQEVSQVLEDFDWKLHFPFSGKIQVRALDAGDILKNTSTPFSFDSEYLPLVAVANTAYDLLYRHASLEEILSSFVTDKI